MALQELKDAIIDEKIPLSALLRRVKVLAAELNSKTVDEWVEKEMNGYEWPGDKDVVPTHRKIACHSYGDFVGVGRQASDMPIPPVCLPDKLKSYAEEHVVLQGAKTLESLAEADQGELVVPWHPDNVVVCGGKIYKDMNCIKAWKAIGRGQLEQILDTTRNRLLEFVLELEKTMPPDAFSTSTGSASGSSAKIEHIFQTTVIGDRNVIMPGAVPSTQPIAHDAVYAQSISTGDSASAKSTATKSNEASKSQGRVKRFFSRVLSSLGLEVVKKWLGL